MTDTHRYLSDTRTFTATAHERFWGGIHPSDETMQILWILRGKETIEDNAEQLRTIRHFVCIVLISPRIKSLEWCWLVMSYNGSHVPGDHDHILIVRGRRWHGGRAGTGQATATRANYWDAGANIYHAFKWPLIILKNLNIMKCCLCFEDFVWANLG